MQSYRTAGHTVETRRTAEGYEFTTYSADGNVISTVLRAIDEAAILLRALATRSN